MRGVGVTVGGGHLNPGLTCILADCSRGCSWVSGVHVWIRVLLSCMVWSLSTLYSVCLVSILVILLLVEINPFRRLKFRSFTAQWLSTMSIALWDLMMLSLFHGEDHWVRECPAFNRIHCSVKQTYYSVYLDRIPWTNVITTVIKQQLLVSVRCFGPKNLNCQEYKSPRSSENHPCRSKYLFHNARYSLPYLVC